MGASSLTCLNPWQRLGVSKIDSRGHKNGQKWPKMLQNGSNNSFVGPDRSKWFKLFKKKVRQGWVPQESWRDQHLPKIVQKTVLWVPMDQNSRNCIEKVRTPICLMKKRTQTDSGDCRPANCWPQIYSQDIQCES